MDNNRLKGDQVSLIEEVDDIWDGICLDDGTGRNVIYVSSHGQKTRNIPNNYVPSFFENGRRHYYYRGSCIGCRRPSPPCLLSKDDGDVVFSFNYCYYCITELTPAVPLPKPTVSTTPLTETRPNSALPYDRMILTSRLQSPNDNAVSRRSSYTSNVSDSRRSSKTSSRPFKSITNLRNNGKLVYDAHDDWPLHCYYNTKRASLNPNRENIISQRSIESKIGVFTTAKIRRNMRRLHQVLAIR
jgi:hypothetical protein